jgi:hypothetical protein
LDYFYGLLPDEDFQDFITKNNISGFITSSSITKNKFKKRFNDVIRNKQNYNSHRNIDDILEEEFAGKSSIQ